MTRYGVLRVALRMRELLEVELVEPADREEALLLVLDDDEFLVGDEPSAETRKAFPTKLLIDGAEHAARGVSKSEAALDRLVECVRGAGGKAETRWIAGQLDCSTAWARMLVVRAVERGLLVEADRGVVAVPPAKAAVPTGPQLKRPAGTSKTTVGPASLDRALAVITKHGPLDVRDLAARMGSTRNNAVARIDELIRQGRAVLGADGKVSVARG